MGTAVRPAKTSPGSWDAFADVDAFVDDVLIELAGMAKDGSRPMRSGPKPPLAEAALQGGHGDLVCRLLRHAVAGDRPAVRDLLRHAVRTVRALDPARPLAPLARPTAPPLAPGLRRCAGAERRGDRQSILSLGAELL